MEKNNCICDENVLNGAILRSFDTTCFEIYGNIERGAIISVRYFGKINNNDTDNKLTYSFEDEQIHTLLLAKCNYATDGYCGVIKLGDNLSIQFTLPNSQTYIMKIAENFYDTFMQKYEEFPKQKDVQCDTSLPVVENTANPFMYVFHKISRIVHKLYSKLTISS